MSNQIVIFMGPTLSVKEGGNILDAIYLPPAKQGDMYAAFLKYKPNYMGLIDGNFENTPAPWHKEILYIMSQGTHVFGSSSMGALRAAELADFGMVGVGQVFQNFYDGNFEDDDEVTVVHGPQELGYPMLSEAMVNIRATLKKAFEDDVLSHDLYKFCLFLLKDTSYKNRSYPYIISSLEQMEMLSVQDVDILSQWFQINAQDVKKDDAIELLSTIKNIIFETSGVPMKKFDFQNTIYWQNMKNEIDANQKKQELTA